MYQYTVLVFKLLWHVYGNVGSEKMNYDKKHKCYIFYIHIKKCKWHQEYVPTRPYSALNICISLSVSLLNLVSSYVNHLFPADIHYFEYNRPAKEKVLNKVKWILFNKFIWILMQYLWKISFRLVVKIYFVTKWNLFLVKEGSVNFYCGKPMLLCSKLLWLWA